MDCLPLPVVCIQCGPGVNNPCHFKFIGALLPCIRIVNLTFPLTPIRTHDRIRHGCLSSNHLLAPRPLLLLLRNGRRQEVSRAAVTWALYPERPPSFSRI